MGGECLQVLVIEDNLALRLSIAALFESQGHSADFAADGRHGLQLALDHPPDVVVLDIGLPGMDGLQVCRALREQSDRHLPILMLTARDSVDDTLRGFDAGADDYLCKPCDKARQRVGDAHVLNIGSLSIDRRSGEVRRQGQLLELQQTPYRILLELAESWPRTLTRSELVQRLWGDEAPPSDPLRSHLYLLRQVLDRPFERAMLKTVHGVGFKDANA